MSVNENNLIAIDTEGGPNNGTPITAALVSSADKVLYKSTANYHGSEYNQMQQNVLRIIRSHVVVGHNVCGDLKQLRLTDIRYVDTQDYQEGSISHSSNRKHDPVEDARKSMQIAKANIHRLQVKTYIA